MLDFLILFSILMQDVLRNINLSIFNDVNTWVHESFKAIRSSGAPGFVEATRSYPVVTDALSKQLSAGLVYTSNISVDSDNNISLHSNLHVKAFSGVQSLNKSFLLVLVFKL